MASTKNTRTAAQLVEGDTTVGGRVVQRVTPNAGMVNIHWQDGSVTAYVRAAQPYRLKAA